MWTWQQLAIMEKQLPDFEPLPIESSQYSDDPSVEASGGIEPTDWFLWFGAITLVLYCLI